MVKRSIEVLYNQLHEDYFKNYTTVFINFVNENNEEDIIEVLRMAKNRDDKIIFKSILEQFAERYQQKLINKI